MAMRLTQRLEVMARGRALVVFWLVLRNPMVSKIHAPLRQWAGWLASQALVQLHLQ